MRYHNNTDVANLDPNAPFSNQNISLDPFFSTLVMFRELSFNDPEVIGDLADRWSYGDDGKTWTFSLNPKARWQNLPPVNGRSVTAADVKWSYELRMNPTYEYKLLPLIDLIASVEAPDAQTVVFRLKEVTNNFIREQGIPGPGILPREVFERDGSFAKTTVGSGPFIFKRWEVGTKMAYERNSNYWKSGADGRPLPYLDGVEVVVIQDIQTQVAAVRTGFLDFYGVQGVEPAVAKPLLGVKGLNVEQSHRMYARGPIFNVSRKPLDDVRVRRAFLKAIDVEQIKEAVVQDSSVPLESWSITGWPEFPYPQEKIRKQFARDVPEARRLLAEAGYSKGMKLGTFLNFSPGLFGTVEYMTVLQQQWADVGIEVGVVSAGDRPAAQARSRQGNYDILFGVNPGTSGDVLSALRSYVSIYRPNPWDWKDQRVDKLVTEARRTFDKAKQAQLIEEAQDIMWQELPSIPLPVAPVFQVQWDYLKGFKNHHSSGNKGIMFAWLDK